MLFADISLARRIEAAARRLTTDVAAHIRALDAGRPVYAAEIAGGAAVHVGSISPFNKLIGAGLHGPLGPADVAALDSIEREFAARDTPLQAEVCTLADGSLGRHLTERGYVLCGFENVLGLRLDAELAGRLAATPPPPGVVTAVADAAEEAGRLWIDTVVTAFAHADVVPGGEAHESFPREAIEQAMTDMLRADGFSRYTARLEGTVAGGASLRICDGVAQLCGAATLPAQRRRGVQTALLVHRLLLAWRSGCDVAVITTQPGSKSQENAQRHGFALLYARAILVR